MSLSKSASVSPSKRFASSTSCAWWLSDVSKENWECLKPFHSVPGGWLSKKARGLSGRRLSGATGWKRRYFVLSEDWGRLTYFDAEDGDRRKALGSVALGGATCDVGLDYVPKRAHVFTLTLRAESDVYYLECASESERRRCPPMHFATPPRNLSALATRLPFCALRHQHITHDHSQ